MNTLSFRRTAVAIKLNKLEAGNKVHKPWRVESPGKNNLIKSRLAGATGEEILALRRTRIR